MQNDQKGISLIITFLIMAIMLAIVLGMSSILSGQIKIMANTSNAMSAFYAAESGIERTLYVNKKCQNCELDYNGSFDGRTYSITTKFLNNTLLISSRGTYKETSRTIDYQR